MSYVIFLWEIFNPPFCLVLGAAALLCSKLVFVLFRARKSTIPVLSTSERENRTVFGGKKVRFEGWMTLPGKASRAIAEILLKAPSNQQQNQQNDRVLSKSLPIYPLFKQKFSKSVFGITSRKQVDAKVDGSALISSTIPSTRCRSYHRTKKRRRHQGTVFKLSLISQPTLCARHL